MNKSLSQLIDDGVIKIKRSKSKRSKNKGSKNKRSKNKKSKKKRKSALKKYQKLSKRSSHKKYIKLNNKSPKIKINKLNTNIKQDNPIQKIDTIQKLDNANKQDKSNKQKRYIINTEYKRPKKISLSKRSKINKSAVDMIEELKNKGIYVSGKNPKLLKDIYRYSLNDNIRIIKL